MPPAANANILVQHYEKFFNNPDNVSVVFEVGANNFVDTRILQKNFSNATIYSFEPRVSKPFSIANNVHVYNKALSDVYLSSSSFYVVEGWEGASSLLKPKKEPGVAWTLTKNIRRIDVEVTTANKFAKENNIKNIDVVWMDVQGNELRVLKGMTDYLKDIKIIQTEAGVREYYENHTLFHEIKNFLSEYGFEVVYNTLEGGRQFSDGVTWEFETDVVFINKNKLENV